ncbi:DUF4339 domain-containing protein [Schlesneria paludicola]|uniref:DUF4339 domain-containing protein n=1 Tax=Schlesneria paludicola TaxID=360056 RepID=UPI00029A5FC6|nr:DUF4339 domain-containing protein [Schlesneria paludicola]
MSDQWLYRIRGQEFGPVSLELVRSLVESGAIAPDDDVRNADRSNWILACAATELRDSIKVGSDRSVERRCDRDEWFCRGAAGDYGPLKMVDLIQLAVEGELGPDEEIKSHADDHWKQVGSIRRLVELLPFSEQRQAAVTQTMRANLVGDLFDVSGRLKPLLESSRERELDSVESILRFSRDGKRVLFEAHGPEAAFYPAHQGEAFDAVPKPDGNLSSISSDGEVREQPDVICFPGIRSLEQGNSHSTSRITNASSIDFIINALGGFGLPSSFNGFDSIPFPDHSNIDQDVSESFWSGWASGKEFTSIGFSELLSWAVTGRLLPTDFVRRGDDGQYVPAVNIPTLFTVRAAANSLSHQTARSNIDGALSSGSKWSPDDAANFSDTLVAIEKTVILAAANSAVIAQQRPSPARFLCRKNNVSSIGLRIVFGIALVLVVWVAGW